MSQSSNYECTVEVQTALHALVERVESAIERAAEFMAACSSHAVTRRSWFAGELFMSMTHGLMVREPLTDRTETLFEEFAAKAWKWADLLDKADPQHSADVRPRIMPQRKD